MTVRSTYRDDQGAWRTLSAAVAVPFGLAARAARAMHEHSVPCWLLHRAFAALARIALAAMLLALGGILMPLLADQPRMPIFTSLEAPPTPHEVAASLAAGIRSFEMDRDTAGAGEAVKAIKAGGGRITAYHIGGGGGGAWERFEIAEFVRRYDTPEEYEALTKDTRRLVGLGADVIHFDNTHRMTEDHLEAVADAIREGGAGFVAKNNPEKWALVMKRRPDLVPAYAVVEDAMFDPDTTQAARELYGMGVAVLIVGFRKPLEENARAVTDQHAAGYKAENPWATVLLMEDELRYDSRTGRFF